MTPYLTLTEADEYFATRIGSDAWLDESAEQESALCTATRAIDRLNYIGQKTDDEQEHEWPRGGDTEVPENIKIACCEEALSLMEGRDPILEEENLRTLSQTYANTKMAFDPKVIAQYILNGITSPVAWRYLKPYVRDVKYIELYRV